MDTSSILEDKLVTNLILYLTELLIGIETSHTSMTEIGADRSDVFYRTSYNNSPHL